MYQGSRWYRRPDTLRPVHNALTFLASFSANWSAHYGVLSILSMRAQKYTRAPDIPTLTPAAPCRVLRAANPDWRKENVVPREINVCLFSNINYCSQLPTLLHDWRRSKLREQHTYLPLFSLAPSPDVTDIYFRSNWNRGPFVLTPKTKEIIILLILIII